MATSMEMLLDMLLPWKTSFDLQEIDEMNIWALTAIKKKGKHVPRIMHK